jgi:hypothetical protein
MAGLAAGVLLTLGCASVPENGHRASSSPLGGISSKLSGSSDNEALRKKVAEDKFPTALEAGI